MSLSVDLTVSCVLYKTDPAEVAMMREQVAAIPLRTHLYLVDNSPGLRPGISTEGDVTTIVTGANLGYGRAHNIAIRLARGTADIHLIANTDVLFDGGAVLTLVDRLKRSNDIGMVAPRVVYPDGKLQYLCRLLPRPADLIGKRFFGWCSWGRRRNDEYELKSWNYASEANIPFLSGCFLLSSHDVLEEVGGFDERYFMYFEDLDLSRRINSRYKTLFVPNSNITHLYRSKISKNKNLTRYLIVSGLRYFSKWGWLFDAHRKRVNAETLMAINHARS
ncbi:hypothetical protein ACFX59_17425 [Sphingomonas sp. NCPPB 2930]|uniref:hypothetical protein n=1 Tax=Sphingomonas sp. NCPPB 2930 TaxID=3162788 RepID=UPI0036DC7E14